MKFSFDELKDKIDKEALEGLLVKYKRQVAVGLIVLVLIIVAIAGSLGSSGDEGDGSETSTAEEITDASEDDAGVSDVEEEEEDDNPLEKDAYPEVNELVQTYYDYIAAGDVDGLATVEDEIDEEEQERILRSTDLVEGYQNISCYTKKGLEEGSYLVFVYYELKFYQIDTAAPGVSPIYVYTNDEGSLVIFNGEADDELNAYVEEMAAEEDVIALMTEVAEAYAAAKAADTDLEELEERYLRIAQDAGTDDEEDSDEDSEEDADGDSEDSEEDADEESEDADTDDSDDGETEDTAAADTGEATEQNRETRFTESVRLRSEPSTDGEYLGTAYQGESVTEIESYESGWSKISYNGTECYCMTQYLE